MIFTRNIYFFLYRNRRFIITWLIITAAIVLGLYFKINKQIITVTVVIFGIVSNAFAGLAGLIAMIPVVGPLIVYSRDVINYRIATIIFLVGFAVGFVLAKLV